jgi:glycerate-2-kinase
MAARSETSNFRSALRSALEGEKGIIEHGGGSDGIDAARECRRALADGQTLARARQRGLDARVPSRTHDTEPFFERLG